MAKEKETVEKRQEEIAALKLKADNATSDETKAVHLKAIQTLESSI